MIAEYPMA